MLNLLRRALLVSVLVATLVVPSGAGAHYIMHSYEAAAAGNQVAYNDCLYRGNPPWSCFTFPLYGPNVYAVSDHTWQVQVGYVQATAWGARNRCNVLINYTHAVLTAHGVSPGC